MQFVKKQQPQTMTQLATDTIKIGILSGELQPGTRLIPSELENRLNLGRVPIREALKELAGTGLVKLLPNRGAIVAPALTLEELYEVFALRYDLEGKAAFRAAKLATPERIAYLRELNALTHQEEQPFPYTQANRTFHLELYKTAGWHFLHKLITQLYDQMIFVRSYFPTDMAMRETFTEEHAAILDALERHDSAAAKKITQRHISWLHNRLKEMAKKQA